MTIEIQKRDMIMVARLAALAIRQQVKDGGHRGSIRAANLHSG